jgi:16S rRNA (cytosine967-C5)-methyltransferase
VHRAGLVRRATAAASAGLTGVIAADGTMPAWRPGSFDRVLVDAPCSGLGALRRRPESRWRRTPSDLEVLVPLQESLLR